MIEIKKEGEQTYNFYLKTREGHTLLKSIDYHSRQEAEGVAERLQKLVEQPSSIERQTNHNGKFLFRLKELNGTVIGSSQFYHSEAGMENGIKNLKNNISPVS